MSFDHKAFAFDWDAFQKELAPILKKALASGDAALIEQFVDENLDACSTPYEGEELGDDWREMVEDHGVQQFGDFALTKYYDPAAGHGLAGELAFEEAKLPQAARKALLGTAFGPSGAKFDPGLMGSYFQSPAQLRKSVETLAKLNAPGLKALIKFFNGVVKKSKGLYVTF